MFIMASFKVWALQNTIFCDVLRCCLVPLSWRRTEYCHHLLYWSRFLWSEGK